MITELLDSASSLTALVWPVAIPFILLIVFLIIRFAYCPRGSKEWWRVLVSGAVRKRLRERKRRLDAIRSRRPGAILPGVPTSQRDFQVEPLIRNRKFREARNYIREQIKMHRELPDAHGRINVYLQYLDLIDGAA